MRSVHRELDEVKGTPDPLDEVARRIARRHRAEAGDAFERAGSVERHLEDAARGVGADRGRHHEEKAAGRLHVVIAADHGDQDAGDGQDRDDGWWVELADHPGGVAGDQREGAGEQHHHAVVHRRFRQVEEDHAAERGDQAVVETAEPGADQ